MYEHEHNSTMSTSAIAAMLSTILYYKRFFPYYVHNVIGGIDDEGKFFYHCLQLSRSVNERIAI